MQDAITRCDFHAFDQGLYVGAAFPCEAVPCIAAVYAISAVVDLREEACDDAAALARQGVDFLHLPTPDHAAVSLPMLRRGVGFVTRELENGRTVLVHCQHGVGRSALLALCVMVERGMEPLDALARAKARRAAVSPSPQQYAGWRAWLEDHAQRTNARWTPPSFDEFAAIAYRHLRHA
ncbi:MAG: dual specificity protein phosphatase family protein [Beijerinckiaceae bacterium]|nr:dual specificity protein phosphatase family protein [Beijerinckiaceae bacterium]